MKPSIGRPARGRDRGREGELLHTPSADDRGDRGRAPTPRHSQQHLYLDKADNPTGRAAVEAAGSIPQLRRIGGEQLDQAASLRHPARRSLVERTLVWPQQCRRLSSATTSSQATLIRYDKQPGHSLGLIQLARARRRSRLLHQAREVQAF